MAEGGARGGSGCLGTASASASPGLASTASGGVAEPRGAVGEAPGGLMRPKSGMMWGVRRPPPPPIDDGGWGDGVDRSASRKALFPPGFKMHLLRRPAPRNDVSPRRSEFQPEPRAASEPGEAASEPAESVGEGEGEAASERLDRWLGKVVAPPTTVHRILRNEAILASKKRTRMQSETDAGATLTIGGIPVTSPAAVGQVHSRASSKPPTSTRPLMLADRAEEEHYDTWMHEEEEELYDEFADDLDTHHRGVHSWSSSSPSGGAGDSGRDNLCEGRKYKDGNGGKGGKRSAKAPVPKCGKGQKDKALPAARSHTSRASDACYMAHDDETSSDQAGYEDEDRAEKDPHETASRPLQPRLPKVPPPARVRISWRSERSRSLQPGPPKVPPPARAKSEPQPVSKAVRMIEQVEHICGVFKGLIVRITGNAYEFPLDEFLGNDPRVELGIGR